MFRLVFQALDDALCGDGIDSELKAKNQKHSWQGTINDYKAVLTPQFTNTYTVSLGETSAF